METEEFLRALIQGQERTNELLKYILAAVALIAFLLFGVRWGWWSL